MKMISPIGNRKSKDRTLAFTLIELMLVMTLLVIVLAVAAPTLGNFFRGRSIESEARRLLALARQGQSRAVFEGVPMMLWIDEKEKTYGLEEESGYTDLDEKAVEFNVQKDLEIEVVNDLFSVRRPVMPSGYNVGMVNNRAYLREQAKLAMSRSIHRHLPAIRFQPDGTVSESSPRSVRLTAPDGESIYLEQSTNRLEYEICQTNQWARP
jgi:type II secretion system protein H